MTAPIGMRWSALPARSASRPMSNASVFATTSRGKTLPGSRLRSAAEPPTRFDFQPRPLGRIFNALFCQIALVDVRQRLAQQGRLGGTPARLDRVKLGPR